MLIAAAACEMHPAAVLRGRSLRSVAEELRRQPPPAAASAGVIDVPAVPGARARVACGEQRGRGGGRAHARGRQSA